MTRFLYNLLGAICTTCATVSLMSLVLRFDYGIHTESPLWFDVLAVIIPTAGAAMFFTGANTYKDRK